MLGEDGLEEYEVQAQLAILEQQFKTAETIYLNNNSLDQAMEMYQAMHKWDEGSYATLPPVFVGRRIFKNCIDICFLIFV